MTTARGMTHRWSWVLLLVLLAGCRVSHPLLTPEVEASLHEALPLPLDAVTTAERLSPEQVSPETADELLARSRRTVAEDLPPEAMLLPLEEVRRDALGNNLDLQVELLSPSIARQQVDRERARFEAVFTPRFSRGESWDAERRWSRSLAARPGITVPLRTGGVTTIELPVTRYEMEDVDVRQYDAAVEFSISHPLLRGAGLEVNEAGILVAELGVRRAEASTKLAAIRVLAEAEVAYWNLYGAQAELQVALQQYEMAQEQVHAATRLVEEGVRSRVEVDRALTGVSQRMESIIVAETTRRRLERDLKRIINRPDLELDGPTILRPATPPNPVGLELLRDRLLELAQENRMELFISEVDLAIDRTSILVARNEVLPRVDLDFTYSFSGQRPHLDQALNRMFDQDLNETTLGVAAEIPLGNLAARAQLRRALLEQAQTESGQEVIRLAIQQDVLNAADAVEQNWLRILAAREEIIRATRTYRGEQRQFGAGLVTSTDVLQAALAVALAQVREIRALRDYQNALVDLSFATGTILGQSGVLWRARQLTDDERGVE